MSFFLLHDPIVLGRRTRNYFCFHFLVWLPLSQGKCIEAPRPYPFPQIQSSRKRLLNLILNVSWLENKGNCSCHLSHWNWFSEISAAFHTHCILYAHTECSLFSDMYNWTFLVLQDSRKILPSEKWTSKVAQNSDFVFTAVFLLIILNNQQLISDRW